jgi:hypothetical protein
MKTDNDQMNKVIKEQLVKPVEIELAKTTILDGREDSWWNTPEYWEEKELDGVRSIIFYTISDSTKVLNALKIHLAEDPNGFYYHDEVSSLLVKIAHQFPNECLNILNESLKDYEQGMKLFSPYGDVIFKFLFERLENEQREILQENLINYLKKEDFEYYNWSPMFNTLYRHGDNKYLEKVITENEERFKPIDSQGYYSVIIQAKAKVNGIETYPELIQILMANPENTNRSKFALFAIQAIARNHELTPSQKNEIRRDLDKVLIPEEIKKLLDETIKLIESSE